MSLRLAVTSAPALALAIGVPTASAGSGGVHIQENGPRSHLTTLCGSAPIPLQAEIGGNGISWYVPASAFPLGVVRGTRLTQVRADTGWVQHYFDHGGLVRGHGAYEQGDEAGGQDAFALR